MPLKIALIVRLLICILKDPDLLIQLYKLKNNKLKVSSKKIYLEKQDRSLQWLHCVLVFLFDFLCKLLLELHYKV